MAPPDPPAKPAQPSPAAGFSLNVYHIMTALLVFFGTSHTVGGLLLAHDFGPAGNAVLASMKSVPISFGGATCTFYDFYLGFGLDTSVFLFFSAGLTWHLSRLAPLLSSSSGRGRGNPVMQALKPVLWMLLVAHIANMLLSWMYFFAGPGVISTAVVLLLLRECLR